MRQSIAADKLNVQIGNLWKNQWFLLTAGDFENQDCNAMTVAWGFLGIMWSKPVAVAVVRPNRYTFEFMEKYDTFTLSAFNDDYKKALKLMGSKSGRDMDKITQSGLTLVKSEVVAAPGFSEAELIIECKKIYTDDFKPENFLDESIDLVYPQKQYHRQYFGEILHISGTEKYL